MTDDTFKPHKEAIEAGDWEACLRLRPRPFPDKIYLESIISSHDKLMFNYLTYAASCGQLECLKQLYKVIKCWGHDRFVVCLAATAAAKNGHLDCLKFAFENECPWDHMVAVYSIENDHFDCFEYYIQNQFYFNELILYAGIKKDIKYFKWLNERGFRSDVNITTYVAAENGKLDCLQYCLENGYVPNEKTACRAALKSFECFKYLYEQGCPIDPQKTLNEILYCNGDPMVLNLLIHDCNVKLTEKDIYIACNHGSYGVLQYAVENFYNFDILVSLKKLNKSFYLASHNEYYKPTQWVITFVKKHTNMITKEEHQNISYYLENL
jgi:hypothetical protein